MRSATNAKPNPRALAALVIGVAAIACTLAGVLVGCRQSMPPGPHVRIGKNTWSVELAQTPAQKYKGMSGRQYIPAGTGMLFVYDKAKVLDYCMRDCYIPIDIAFIGPDRRIVKIFTMPVEKDRVGDVAYSSGVPAQWVLETAGGEFARLGVKVGDEVEFSREVESSAGSGD